MNNDSESDFYIENLFEETNNIVATQDQVKENIKQIFSTLTEQFKEELRISELKQKPTKLEERDEAKRKYKSRIDFNQIQCHKCNEMGHFANKCKEFNKRNRRNNNRRNNNKTIKVLKLDEKESGEKEEFFMRFQRIKDELDNIVKNKLEEWLFETKVQKLLKEKEEKLIKVTEYEIRELLEWGYDRKEIFEDEIIMKYREIDNELNIYDDNKEEVKEKLNKYIEVWKQIQEIIEENIEENNKKKCGDKMNIEEMSNERKEILKELLKKYENIFEYKLRKIKEIKHEIEINERQESILRKRYEEIKEKGINELQEKVNKLFQNIIEI
jgi:hypothetical protein